MMRSLLPVIVVSAFGVATCPTSAQTSAEDIARKAEKAVQGGSERDYQRELTRGIWTEMRTAATEGGQAVKELRVMAASFRNQMKDLLESTDGRKLATSAEAVTAIIDLQSRPLPTETELQGCRRSRARGVLVGSSPIRGTRPSAGRWPAPSRTPA